jgi:riboflavin kinase/FMN adenylyltransferase
MRLIHDMHWCPDFADGSVVTVGEFDGLHRGHRIILSEVCSHAAVRGCPAIVVTFDRDPAQVTNPESAPKELTSLEQKLELIAASGVDFTVVLRAEQVASDPGQSDRSNSDVMRWLVQNILVGHLKGRAVVVGEEFHFGLQRRQSLEVLDQQSGPLGYDVVRVPLADRLTTEGDVISSKTIRDALDAGDVVLAQRMLGRGYEIRSIVAEGDRRGRTIGFPTANLPVPEETQLPADGVYACWFLREDGSRIKAATNVGKRPTFYADNVRSLVEAHLIGFRGDLYGENSRLVFVRRLRGEQRFSGVDELVAQLKVDISCTADALVG